MTGAPFQYIDAAHAHSTPQLPLVTIASFPLEIQIHLLAIYVH
jgi:hypothetical protein